MKPLYVHIPPQYKKAMSLLKFKTERTYRELAMEAITDLAKKHGLIHEEGDLLTRPEWD